MTVAVRSQIVHALSRCPRCLSIGANPLAASLTTE
jgi:hypothetical protein